MTTSVARAKLASWLGVWIVLVAPAGLLAAAVPAPAPPATAMGGSCLAAVDLKAFQKTYIADATRAAAAASTTLLPAKNGARLLFNAPLKSERGNVDFKVFETELDHQNSSAFHLKNEITVSSVDPANNELGGKFKPGDSVSLLVEIPPSTIPWEVRTFAIVSCVGKDANGWGLVSAPVSDPNIITWICIGSGLALYCLAMIAMFYIRNNPSDIVLKYPAIFGARPLKWYDFFNPIHLAANAFNQGSVQKAQVILFTFLVGELVLARALSTGALVGLSVTVVGLLGISGIGAAAAQAAYQQKTRLSFSNWSWLERDGVLKRPDLADRGPFWHDLLLTNREFDVYKLQTIVFTLAVATALVVAGSSHLSTFAVPETLLGVLGLSQIVYVGGVLVKPPAIGDLDDAITKFRVAWQTLQTARKQNTDTDSNGKLLAGPLPAGQTAAANARQQYDELADNLFGMIESALEIEVASLDKLKDQSSPPPNGGTSEQK